MSERRHAVRDPADRLRPHALACAALLGDRIPAAAVFASAGPADQPDLDFTAGMGEDNVVEFGAALEGEDKLRPLHEQFAAAMQGTTPQQLADELRTLIGEPDRAVLTAAGASTWRPSRSPSSSGRARRT